MYSYVTTRLALLTGRQTRQPSSPVPARAKRALYWEMLLISLSVLSFTHVLHSQIHTGRTGGRCASKLCHSTTLRAPPILAQYVPSYVNVGFGIGTPAVVGWVPITLPLFVPVFAPVSIGHLRNGHIQATPPRKAKGAWPWPERLGF